MKFSKPIQTQYTILKPRILAPNNFASRIGVAGILLFLAIFFFVVLPQPARGAVLWSENFETGGNNWHADSGTWEVGTPTSGPNAAYKGTICAGTVLGGSYAATVNSRLIRHVSFTVPAAAQNPRLRFWHWYSIASNDYGVVQIKAAGESEWTEISAHYTSTSSGVWTRPYLDLTAYAGQNVQIAFYFYARSLYESSGWYIDDLEVITGDPVFANPEGWESGLGDWSADLGTWEIGTPTSGPGAAYNESSQCAATVLKGNYHSTVSSRLTSPFFTVPAAAQNPRLRFWHWYSIASNDYGVVQIKAAGESEWTEISAHYTSTSSGVWTRPYLDLTAYAGQNVQIAFYFYARSLYESAGWYIDDLEVITGDPVFANPEGWESGLGDWSVDLGTWEIGTPTSGPGAAYNESSQCAATVLKGNYHSTVSSRLTSPFFTVPAAAQNPRLRFWHWYNIASNDYGVVQIKAAGESEWTEISAHYTSTSSGVWTRPYLDLTAYAGQNVQIAFYFYARSLYESAGWYIDDVTIEPVILQEPILSVTPASQNVTSAGGTTTFLVANTGTGNLNWTAAVASGNDWLSITPTSGVNAGTINGTYAANSSASPRTATITFSATGATGSPINVTVTQAAAPQTGSLTVTITPAAAVTAGAQWRVDSGAWRNSGTSASGLTQGSHLLSFKSIIGWVTPVTQTVTIAAGENTLATGTYYQPILSVTPTHRNITSAGGTTTFSVANTGTGALNWTAAVTSGNDWLSITPTSGVNAGTINGAYAANSSASARTATITFSATGVTGSPINVTVTQAAAPQTGSLTVTITPAAAVTAGAQWRVDSGAWQNSGGTVSGLSAGNHTISFQPITGWTTPLNRVVTITAGQTALDSGNYIQQQAILSVSPASRNVGKEAGTTIFSVSNTGAGIMNWSADVTSGGDWLSFDPVTGTNNGTITCNYSANADPAERTATLRITASGAMGSPKDVKVTQVGTPPDPVTRSVQTYYIPGVKITVTLSANPVSGTVFYAIEDTPPAGWTVSDWSEDGSYDPQNHKIKFGPFYDCSPRTFTYAVTPPTGTNGVQSFDGLGSMDGTDYVIVGVSNIEPGDYHPADRNPADYVMAIGELTAYGAAWKNGTAWPAAPNSIPITYITKAAQLWKLGEHYMYDPALGVPPLCWENISIQANYAMIAADASTAVRIMPQVYIPGVPFTVTIVVTPSADVSAYAVEDAIPDGWEISNVSDAGSFDAIDNKVKFGPFMDQSERSLTYDVTPPTTAAGSQHFTGMASFDGSMMEITGIQNIDTVFPKLADVIKGLQVLIGVETDIDNSLADANGNGKVETSDVIENFRKISGKK